MINVPPIKQSDSSRCGPTVVKMILSYYGVDATEEELCVRCGHSFEKGCTDKGMMNAFKSYGFSTKLYNNSTLEDLEYWIKHHIPVIVDFFYGGSDVSIMPDGHSGIIVDIDKESVYLLDPNTARILTIHREDFERVWFDWKDSPTITSWRNMVLRQIIVAYPSRLKK
jgi:ABC-type bacteriocin/lantibiotic exporter with double-glycine peptidase domain